MACDVCGRDWLGSDSTCLLCLTWAIGAVLLLVGLLKADAKAIV